MALVQLAIAIVLGARSMRQIDLLAHQAPLFGAPPSDSTIRRVLAQAAADRPALAITRGRAAVVPGYGICWPPASTAFPR